MRQTQAVYSLPGLPMSTPRYTRPGLPSQSEAHAGHEQAWPPLWHGMTLFMALHNLTMPTTRRLRLLPVAQGLCPSRDAS
jgi:hypothetical protein